MSRCTTTSFVLWASLTAITTCSKRASARSTSSGSVSTNLSRPTPRYGETWYAGSSRE
jgi:hypothetical protein